MNYLKYYWLEKKFFPEVYNFFHEKGYITPEHFFSIVVWKSIRPRKLIKHGLLRNGETINNAVHNLSKKIFKAKSKEEKLEILLGNKEKKQPKQKGFQLAMASAVLTILYPEEFTIYDRRVRSQLINPQNRIKNYSDITSSQKVVEKYFHEYIPQVLKLGGKISGNKQLSLRDCDRLLWAKSWHEDLENFLKK